MDAVQSFKKTVQRHRLFDKSHKLLLAVSGGADSTAMCHICSELGYDFGIVHVNYQLRGIDSDQDALFVESLASSLKRDFYLKTVDCTKFANKKNLSIQEAARNIRYDFFDSILSLHDFDKVLTAHHAQDNVETIVYTLSKGASLGALRGIPISRDMVVRPLLYTTKSAIDLYNRSNDLRHRHDISNDDTKYNRNYIRHEILPRLKQLNPSIASTLINTSMLGAGYQELLSHLLIGQKDQFTKTNKLDLQEIQARPYRFAWLYEMIQPLGFNFNDVLDIWHTMDQKHSTGKTFQQSGYQLTIDRGQLILSIEKDIVDTKPIQINSIETASRDSNDRVGIDRLNTLPSKAGTYIDMDQLKFPLTLRRWLPGDRFRPYGMKGKSKKVKDYLTDQKISGAKRSAVEVLIHQDEIIWVVNHRLAHGFKANSKTQSIISITVK